MQDPSFAEELTEALEMEMRQNSRQVHEEDLQRRGRLGRWVDAFSYFMLRVGVAITGKSSEY